MLAHVKHQLASACAAILPLLRRPLCPSVQGKASLVFFNFERMKCNSCSVKRLGYILIILELKGVAWRVRCVDWRELEGIDIDRTIDDTNRVQTRRCGCC
jgi:hypothetical protein